MIKMNNIGSEQALSPTHNQSLTDSATPNFDQLFADLRQRVAYDLVMLVSSMPRGGLQVVQPERLSEPWTRSYARDFATEDRVTWAAIQQQKPVTTADIWPDGGGRYLNEFVRPAGYEHVAAVPLDAPILRGYAGALHVYRRAEQGEFTQGDLYELTPFATRLDQIATSRQQSAVAVDDLDHPVRSRQFVFDANGRQLLNASNLEELDPRLVEQVREQVAQLMGDVERAAGKADRVSLPDSRGDLWNFRVKFYQEYPALAQTPVVFFNLVPEPREWAALTPGDFAADAELARMVPAIHFMFNEFHRVPTLQEISRTVHLSPFHFHRRFTELFGLTPKHFLLDCQIAVAKRELLARRKELSEIAAACGFAHQSHFTSRFKQATGLTPTRWRRIVGEPAQS